MQKDTIELQERTVEGAVRSVEDTQEKFTKTQEEGRAKASQTPGGVVHRRMRNCGKKIFPSTMTCLKNQKKQGVT